MRALRKEGLAAAFVLVLGVGGAHGQAVDGADWVHKNTDIPDSAIVVLDKDYAVALVRKSDPSTDHHVFASIREEIFSPSLATRDGGKSSQLDLEFVCDKHNFRINDRLVFSESNLKGDRQRSGPSDGWFDIPAGSAFDAVLKAVCTEGRAEPVAAAAPAPIPASPPPSLVASASPAASPPKVAATPAAPAAAPVPSAPPRRSPRETAGIRSDAKAASAQPAAPAPAAAGVRSTSLTFQIAGYTSSKAAADSWSSLQRRYAKQTEGLSHTVAVIDIGGRTYYRSLVSGFRDQDEAAKFCKFMGSIKLGCIQRASNDAGSDAPSAPAAASSAE